MSTTSRCCILPPIGVAVSTNVGSVFHRSIGSALCLLGPHDCVLTHIMLIFLRAEACKMIKPIYEEMAKEYSDKISFGKVDVDENEDAAVSCRLYCPRSCRAPLHALRIGIILLYQNAETHQRF